MKKLIGLLLIVLAFTSCEPALDSFAGVYQPLSIADFTEDLSSSTHLLQLDADGTLIIRTGRDYIEIGTCIEGSSTSYYKWMYKNHESSICFYTTDEDTLLKFMVGSNPSYEIMYKKIPSRAPAVKVSTEEKENINKWLN